MEPYRSARHVTARRRLPGQRPPISERTSAESPRERFAVENGFRKIDDGSPLDAGI